MKMERLTSEEVAALLSALERPAVPDRRQFPRTPVRGRARAVLSVSGGDRRMSAVVRDLSRSGMGVSSPVPLDVGAEAEVTVEVPGRPPLCAICRVTGCRPDADADVAAVRYVLGLEFLRILRGGG